MNRLAEFLRREYQALVGYVRRRIDDAADQDAEDIGKGEGSVPGNGRTWRHFRQYWQEEGRAAFESFLQRMHDQEEKKSSKE